MLLVLLELLFLALVLPFIHLCCNIIVYDDMAPHHSERIPLKVFIVSYHSSFMYNGRKLTLQRVVNEILFGLALSWQPLE